MQSCESAIVGSLLGTAVGDALGLPYEGLSPRRAARMLGPPDRYRLLLGRGMVSDDTEHACMVAQALIASGSDVPRFRRELAKRLRLWLLGLPAGIGLATLRACLRLCVGVPPDRSGVFSAGNGPAMRSPILGAAIDDLPLLQAMVEASTCITHSDPKALYGALAVALAAHSARRPQTVSGECYLEELTQLLPPAGNELLELIARAIAAGSESTPAFADSLGLARGVTGYMYHTVPVVIHAWLRHPHDFRSAITDVIRCGGDTDTTAAILGGIVGSAVGRDGIPPEWLRELCDWPRTVRWMERLGCSLSTGLPKRPPRLPFYGILPRNFCFAAIVLGHGFRRLLPPY